MSSEMQNNIIKLIMNQCLNSEETNGYSRRIKVDLEIEEICGIKVNVAFEVLWCIAESKPNGLYLRILASDIWVDHDGDIDNANLFIKSFDFVKTDLPVQNIQNCLQQTAEILNHITFDKIVGKFTTSKEFIPKIPLFCKAFGVTNSKIKSKIDDCCVCYDATITQTQCGHVLCIPCWDSIKATPSPDEDELDQKRCPICRESLFI